MITRFFLPKLDDIDVANMWFQQDGATCHTARETLQLMHETFPGRVLSRFGDQNWPPRSCDLTPLDFFLWGYLKSQRHIGIIATFPLLLLSYYVNPTLNPVIVWKVPYPLD
ncbi:hypothetical protein O3M35_005613 [Rhynocoris fuscipes]|uniref:Tc1-like transposase DDE domain-containing protein n=1 Tax=Rhynocoris fuscipes TaxID=488301 RepID=A0AAW1DPR5_9HEMI